MSSKKLLAGLAALAASVAVTAAPAAQAQPAPLTAPLGSTTGSFIDATMVYGSTGYQKEPTSIEFPNAYQHNQTDLEF